MNKHYHFAAFNLNLAGHGATVENFNTCRTFLHPKNRETVIKMFNPKNTIEETNLRKSLQMSHVILSVTNSIGKVKCNDFKDYLKKFAIHWVKAFGKWRTLKNSLHWSLAHVGQLIAENEGYSMAEYSENSLEALIKR